MISEGSCDTEDWSNDAKNSALITGINYILKYIQIENSDFKYKFINVLFLLYSGPNKYGLGEQTRFLQKHITTRTVQKPSCTCFRSDTFREQSQRTRRRARNACCAQCACRTHFSAALLPRASHSGKCNE